MIVGSFLFYDFYNQLPLYLVLDLLDPILGLFLILVFLFEFIVAVDAGLLVPFPNVVVHFLLVLKQFKF